MTERTPKDHRLFHYTPKFEFLLDMLQNGVWPRYCEENFEWLVENPAWLAVPMVCFCDIPIEAASNHRNTYGSYAISISKTWAGSLDINPVWYVHDESTIAEHIRKSIVTHPRFSVSKNEGNQMFKTLAFIKPTIGSQYSRSLKGSTSILAFEEEMEWRHTPKTLNTEWLSASHCNFLRDEDHERSKNHRLIVKPDQVENVFVTSTDEVDTLTSKHPSLVGRVSTW